MTIWKTSLGQVPGSITFISSNHTSQKNGEEVLHRIDSQVRSKILLLTNPIFSLQRKYH